MLDKPRFLEFPPPLETEARPQQLGTLAARFIYDSEKPRAKHLTYNKELAQQLSLVGKPAQPLKLLTVQTSTTDAFAYNYGGHQFGHWTDQLAAPDWAKTSSIQMNSCSS